MWDREAGMLDGMRFAADPLPDDVETLRRMVQERDAAIAALDGELTCSRFLIEKLKLQIARLKRAAFGRSSERLEAEIAQLELALEELELTEAVQALARPTGTGGNGSEKPARRPLPDHLPREEVVHEAACACPRCGGALRRLGEDVMELLEYVPATFKVIRHVRPKMSCRVCESITQAAMPSLPVLRGRAGPALLAHVLVAKYGHHLPLHRQAAIYAHAGVEIERSTLADWVGQTAALLDPLVTALREEVLASCVLHGDDTPVPVLAPGTGRTKTGRLWVYVRDERLHAGSAPPAAIYFYSPDRRGERPRTHLARFRGHLHADGYAGFNGLYAPDASGAARIVEVACWAHARRKFFDIHAANGSPIAREAVERIGRLYEIEAEIRGRPPGARRDERRARAGPVLDELKAWLELQKSRVPGRGELAGAIRYALARWDALLRYVSEGTLEVDNNAAVRALRGIAVGRRNWTFAGSDAGGERAAAVYSLVETAKLNGLDPEAWLADVIARIADHPARRITELLPWNWARQQACAQAA